MSQQNLNKIYSQVKTTQELSSDVTLDKYDTGKVFLVDCSNNIQVDLPFPADADLTGWHVKFILDTSNGIGGSFDIVSDDDGVARLEGSSVNTAFEVEPAVEEEEGEPGAAGAVIVDLGVAVTGDVCEIICVDGTVPEYVATCKSQA